MKKKQLKKDFEQGFEYVFQQNKDEMKDRVQRVLPNELSFEEEVIEETIKSILCVLEEHLKLSHDEFENKFKYHRPFDLYIDIIILTDKLKKEIRKGEEYYYLLNKKQIQQHVIELVKSKQDLDRKCKQIIKIIKEQLKLDFYFNPFIEKEKRGFEKYFKRYLHSIIIIEELRVDNKTVEHDCYEMIKKIVNEKFINTKKYYDIRNKYGLKRPSKRDRKNESHKLGTRVFFNFKRKCQQKRDFFLPCSFERYIHGFLSYRYQDLLKEEKETAGISRIPTGEYAIIIPTYEVKNLRNMEERDIRLGGLELNDVLSELKKDKQITKNIKMVIKYWKGKESKEDVMNRYNISLKELRQIEQQITTKANDIFAR